MRRRPLRSNGRPLPVRTRLRVLSAPFLLAQVRSRNTNCRGGNVVVNDDSCRGQLLHLAGFWVVRGVGAAW